MRFATWGQDRLPKCWHVAGFKPTAEDLQAGGVHEAETPPGDSSATWIKEYGLGHGSGYLSFEILSDGTMKHVAGDFCSC